MFGAASFEELSLYDAPFWYDLDYQGYKAEEAFYRLLVTQHVDKGGAYVELGAGTGRLLLAYAKAGTRCHAVEPAGPMLFRLYEHAEAGGLPEGLVTGEQRGAATFEGPDDVPAQVITFPFNGLLHVHGHAALLEVFARVRDKLDDQGRFGLDMTSPAWEEMAAGGRAWGRLDERVHPGSGQRIHTCDRCRYDEYTRLMHTDFRFLEDGADRGVTLGITQYMWTYQEVVHLLHRAGFSIDMVFGDVDFSPLYEKSPRLLLSAAKA